MPTNKTISQETPVSSITGSELIDCVQSGSNASCTPDDILDYGSTRTETLLNKTVTSAILVTPSLGTPSSGNLSNCTNIPLASASGTLPGANGGTGVSNSGKTITLGGNLTTSGSYSTTLTVSGSTNVTLPTTGTLATTGGSETFTNKTIAFSGNTLTNVASINTAQNLSGKQIIQRVFTGASASTLSPDFDQFDVYEFTALAAATLSINAPANPQDKGTQVFFFTDDGTARTLSWGAGYEDYFDTLPTSTTVGKKTMVAVFYDGPANKTRCMVTKVQL